MQQHLIRQRTQITDDRTTIGDHHRQIHRAISTNRANATTTSRHALTTGPD